MSSLKKSLFSSSAHFKIRLFVCLFICSTYFIPDIQITQERELYEVGKW